MTSFAVAVIVRVANGRALGINLCVKLNFEELSTTSSGRQTLAGDRSVHAQLKPLRDRLSL